MSGTQLPPADELAAIRAQQKELEAREAELKALLISDPSSRTGNRFLAEIRETETQRTDLKELRAAYPDAVAEHTFQAKVTRIELRNIDHETGEIVGMRRAPKLNTLRVV